MKGYVVRKGNQRYTGIHEGLDPLTGRERRRWHPAAPGPCGHRIPRAEVSGIRRASRDDARPGTLFGMFDNSDRRAEALPMGGPLTCANGGGGRI